MQNPLRKTRLLDSLDLESPARGDEILLVAADGRPNGLSSHVRTLESSDRVEGMYEVQDDRGRRMIITRQHSDTWIQLLGVNDG